MKPQLPAVPYPIYNTQHPDLREECGVCGVYNHRDASHLVYLGLTALQHRGQESAGIVSFNGRMNRHAGMGLVFDVFKRNHINFLKGRTAIGHVRYSTTGSSILQNAQPLLVTTPYGQVAVGHNGNLTNADKLRKDFESSGAIFQTTTDSEVLLHLIARSKAKNIVEAVKWAVQKVDGAYSVLISCDRNSQGGEGPVMIGVRDPRGFRPLILGKVGGAWVITSETCVFDLIGGTVFREIEPGEMVVIENNQVRSVRFGDPKAKKSLCVFEFVYFARPDSKIFGESVYQVRRNMGRMLARQAPPPKSADCVIAVPDSAVVAAIGYAEESKLPFEVGFIRSHYVGRTFIEPSKPMRDFRARIKYNPIKENLRGRSIIVVDDSIVRGTTSKKLIRMLKNAGAREIHLRISSPPIVGPCYYGIDTPTKAELIASTHSVEEIRRFLGVDSLAYLNTENLLRSSNEKPENFCVACFTGKYPTRIDEKTVPAKKFETMKRVDK